MLVYAGYLGGSGDDIARDIAVDAAGNAYVVGQTDSDETSFPVTAGPDLTYNGIFLDAFVAKVAADGSGLVYAGYLGGSGDDFGQGIAVDTADNAYVVGSTTSDETSFPVTVGPDLTFNGGGQGNYDAFVAKVAADGSRLVYAGYVGGSTADYATGIAVDGAGNVYITGLTQSNQASFPVIGGPDLTYNGGGYDAFVAKLPQTIYNFSNFLPPLDNPPAFNVASAGKAVPVRFSLGGNQGLNIFAAGFPISQQIRCDTAAPLGDIQATVAAGGGLSYNPLTDQYSYIWKTNTAWAGTCRQLVIRLIDGSDHVANFQFK